MTRLIKCMRDNAVEAWEKVVTLRQELGELHQTTRFDDCKSMGAIVERNLEITLARHMD